jgi:hypothetical protein
MKKVKLNTRELLAIVKDNLVKHMKEYTEAVTDHKLVVVKVAKDNSKLAKANVKMANLYKLASMTMVAQFVCLSCL